MGKAEAEEGKILKRLVKEGNIYKRGRGVRGDSRRDRLGRGFLQGRGERSGNFKKDGNFI